MPGLFHAADSGLIELLVVTGVRRGEGIGRRLVETALRVFDDAGCAEASVSTGAENETARSCTPTPASPKRRYCSRSTSERPAASGRKSKS